VSRSTDPGVLLDQARRGDRAALARLLSIVERGGSPAHSLAALSYRVPPPYTVGLTGAPGAGKSTLTDRLITVARHGWPGSGRGDRREREPEPDGREPESDGRGAEPDGREPEPDGREPEPDGRGAEPDGRGAEPDGREPEPVDQVAVLAVDPSSPFSGGAILGDRVRMQGHATDPSVFIRSMATRGHLGGLALAVPDAVRVLGSVGVPLVIVETVGVGQMEVEVASATDTTVVVVTPGWGDSMQANKAGLLEVADVLVINKADRPGVRETRRDLEQMIDLSAPSDWRPCVVETVATSDAGVDSLWDAVARHRAYLAERGELARRRTGRLAQELRRVLEARALIEIDRTAAGAAFGQAVEAMAAGRLDPYRAADQLRSYAEGVA